MKILLPACFLAILSLHAALAAAAAVEEGSSRQGECRALFVPANGSYQFVQEEVAEFDVGLGDRVGEVYYTRLPIFDESNPKENNALFRWANRFHFMTRERVIFQQVLFAQGENYSEKLLQESARLLRSQDYFYDADVRPVRRCDDGTRVQVDIEVITKDTWSLTPNFSFDRSGGENTYKFGIRDSNMLGLGKHFEIVSNEDIDRRSRELIYEDPNVLGTRVRNRTRFIDSDDGSNQLFQLALPFYSLDSKRSWSISLENEERVDEQFLLGDEVSEVKHSIEDFVLDYGISAGLQNNAAQRWTVGYRYRTDKFAPGDDLSAPIYFPIDKELSYPYVGFELIEDNFDTAFNLDQIYRTEDLHLGRRLLGSIGYAARSFGSDQDRIVVNGLFSDTLAYSDNVLWQHSLKWEGLWNLDQREAEDVVVSYQSRYIKRRSSRRSFFARLEAVYSKNLNTNSQITFGGLTGARAFENRFQVGDRRVSLVLEERIYSDIHLFNLIRVGGALFIDVGRAWEPGVDSGLEDELLADIGIGLRLASSKAASGRVVHIDLAFPLRNRNDGIVKKFQIAFNVKGTF